LVEEDWDQGTFDEVAKAVMAPYVYASLLEPSVTKTLDRLLRSRLRRRLGTSANVVLPLLSQARETASDTVSRTATSGGNSETS
jgi:hypothetical protein